MDLTWAVCCKNYLGRTVRHLLNHSRHIDNGYFFFGRQIYDFIRNAALQNESHGLCDVFDIRECPRLLAGTMNGDGLAMQSLLEKYKRRQGPTHLFSVKRRKAQ